MSQINSEACAIACQNCAVFPSGMTSHSKIAPINWECIGCLINKYTKNVWLQCLGRVFLWTENTVSSQSVGKLAFYLLSLSPHSLDFNFLFAPCS
jgi:hypothetical protein